MKASWKRWIIIGIIGLLIGAGMLLWHRGGSVTPSVLPAAAMPAATAAEAPSPADTTDCLALFRYSEDRGSLASGCLPADTDPRLLDRAAVGEDGILLLRRKEEGGDCYDFEPWLQRPGGSGRSLGPPEHCFDSNLRWLPGADLIVMHEGQEIRVVDPSGAVVRRFIPDAASRILKMEVNRRTGEIAALLLPTTAERTTPPPLADLAVLTPAGQILARLEKVADIPHSDGFWNPVDLFWFDDGRIALSRRMGSEPPTEGEGGELRTVIIADPARRVATATGVFTEKIQAASPDGRLLLTEGRLYDVPSGRTTDLGLPPGVFLDRENFSPDGRLITARASGENGVRMVGVFRLQEKAWTELGRGQAVGWSPEGVLYWTDAAE